MTDLDTSGWEAVGETSNTAYFAVEPGVLAAVPRPGSADDESSAEENVLFQNGYFRTRGRGGVVVVFFDRMSSQDKDARRVYQKLPDPALMRGTALVGGSLLGRAMASFFLGLSKPEVPIKMCSSLDDALVWARKINSERDRKSAGSNES